MGVRTHKLFELFVRFLFVSHGVLYVNERTVEQFPEQHGFCHPRPLLTKRNLRGSKITAMRPRNYGRLNSSNSC